MFVHPLRRRPRAALARSLGVECILLVGFATSCLAGMPFRDIDAPCAVVALLFGMAAMGAQSALVPYGQKIETVENTVNYPFPA
jgi:hypothetical protein